MYCRWDMTRRRELLAGKRSGAVMLAAALLLAGEACAQSPSESGPLSLFDNIFTGSLSKGAPSNPSAQRPGTSAQAQPAPAGNSAPPPWSGEDGASGHPLMTASAIREAAANFDSCIASMWPDAARRGISQQSFQRFTAGLAPDLRIMDLMDSQPEFTKSIWDYLDILVNDNRLAKGREILAKYKPQFDAVEKAYGVDRYAIAAIWGIEFELLHPDGRSQRIAIHSNAGLHRPSPKILQGRISLGAGNPASRRFASRADARLLGRRVRAHAIHADRIQALRGGR